MRLYTEQDLARDRPIPLTAPQAHYLRNVMRANVGDDVLLFNGRDGEWSARIDVLHKGSGGLLPQNQRRLQVPEPGPWLLFAPLKRAPLDFLVQKAVELGASVLQPVQTANTNTGRINLDRMNANAIEAAEQCERLTVPEVRSAEKHTFLLENWPEDRYLLVCAEHGAAQPIDNVLRAAPRDSAWGILTGPEGGFVSSELNQLRKLPFARTVSLGPRILRAETAALAALTCWQAVLGDWRDGRPEFHETSTRTT
jgi:16S rRNA (uracil1498-N3)-methyltransferase